MPGTASKVTPGTHRRGSGRVLAGFPSLARKMGLGKLQRGRAAGALRYTARMWGWWGCRPAVVAGRVATMLALVLCTSCGYAVQLGVDLVSGGSEPDAAAAASGTPPPTLAIPPPARALPPGALYGHEVLARMRGEAGKRKRRSLWSEEFDGKRVAGQGKVTKLLPMGQAGPLHTAVWMDLDADGEVDVIYHYVGVDPTALAGLQEGSQAWYDGTLKRYEKRLIVTGENIRGWF